MEAFDLHLKTECVNFKVTPPPTHWKELDPKGMKVIELRSELDARGLSTKGVKTILAERLQKSLDEEKQKESEASSLGFSLTTSTAHVFQ